jgi:nitric oxide dioxygenase
MVYSPDADEKHAATLPRPPPLTTRQKDLIKESLPKLALVGPTITRLTFGGLLDDYPGLANILSHSKHEVRVNLPGLVFQIVWLTRDLQTGLQSDALAGAIYLLGEHIDDFEEFMKPTVERIAQRHASLHITPAQYNGVEAYLMKGFTECFGPDVFKGELYTAWWAA